MGLILGSFCSAKIPNHYSLYSIIKMGICATTIGVIALFITLLTRLPVLFSLFMPIIIVYFGLCFILVNASTLVMSRAEDKAHTSAVMNFINIGTATVVVLGGGYFTITPLLLPTIFLILCILMFFVTFLMQFKTP